MAWTNVESALALSLGFPHEVAVATRPMTVMTTERVRARMAACENRGYATLAGGARWRCRIARVRAVLPLRRKTA